MSRCRAEDRRRRWPARSARRSSSWSPVLPTTRTGTPEEAADLAEASARLRPLRDALTSLVQEDSDAYAAVVAAMRLPKATDADKRARRAAIETAMQRATEVPLETMRCCQQALRGAIDRRRERQPERRPPTRPPASSCSSPGCAAPGLNVDVNIGRVSDAAFASRVAEERRQLAADAEADAHRAREQLGQRIAASPRRAQVSGTGH